jgi:hypothetical protein
MTFIGQIGARVRHGGARRRARRAALLGVVMLVGALAQSGCFPSKSASTSTGSADSTGSASASATAGVATTAAVPAAVETATTAATEQEQAAVTKPSSSITNVTHQPTWIVKNGVADSGAHTLNCDYVQFLTGAAAEKAAKKHGDTVENDYYVVNDNAAKRTIPVAAGVTIVLHPGDGPQFKRVFTLAQFEDLMDNTSATYGGRTYMWSSDTTYYVNVKNGKITRIENQWVP